MAARVCRSRRVASRALLALLNERFGLHAFRPGQEAVIRSVIDGTDTLAVMPTGAGKSLCYQLPALLLPGTTVVVSPLIALMNDQAGKLDEAGVKIATINSTLKRSEQSAALTRIARQASEIVFVTPEQLGTPEVMARLARNPIDVFVIDEAHCISQWGHDFRPAFLQIATAIDTLGNPPVLALTATATQAVIDDIRSQLRRPKMQLINASIYRPNLHYAVRQASSDEEKLAMLEQALERAGGPAIVYTATVKAAEAVHAHLLSKSLPALLYHGRLAPSARNAAQAEFMARDDAVMVATNAFGMGIDKPNVRAVIHYQMPASLDSYYQESGRAGRDGADADCILLFEHADKRIQAFFLARRYPQVEDVERLWDLLKQQAGCGLQARALSKLPTGMPANKARVALEALVHARVAETHNGRTRALAPILDAALAQRVVDNYRARAERDRDKLEQLIAYAQTGRCRWLTLMNYFGEQPGWQRCEGCDNCRHPPRPVIAERADASPPPDPLQPGRLVRVPRYGEGTVAAVAGDIVTIAFPRARRRNFLRSFVRVVEGGD